MPMSDELTRLLPRIGEAHAKDCVVQPRLQELEQVVACHTALADCLGIRLAELGLQYTVVAAHLLLLPQLHAIFRRTPGAALPMLPGRKVARRRLLDDRALRPIATSTLEIKLEAFAAAKPADWSCITRHSS